MRTAISEALCAMAGVTSPAPTKADTATDIFTNLSMICTKRPFGRGLFLSDPELNRNHGEIEAGTACSRSEIAPVAISPHR
jgi:hypothetical protein